MPEFELATQRRDKSVPASNDNTRSNGSVRKLRMSVVGMTCSSCSNTVEAALQETQGVLSATVVLATNKAIVEYDGSVVQAAAIVDLLDNIGFGGSLEEDGPVKHQPVLVSPVRKLIVAIEGMTCSSCSGTIETALNGTDGVLSVSVVLATNKGIVEYDSTIVQAAALISLLEDVGFGGSIEDDSPATADISLTGNEIGASAIKKLIMKCEGSIPIDGARRPSILAALESCAGVVSTQFLDGFSVQVSYNDEISGPRVFYNALADMGIRSSAVPMGGFLSAGKMSSARTSETDHAKWSFLTALFFTLPLVLLSDILPMIGYVSMDSPLYKPLLPGMSLNSLLLLLLCTPVQVIIGWKFHKKAIKSVMVRNLGMDFLVSTGTTSAYVYSLVHFVRNVAVGVKDMEMEMEGLMYFETAAVLITVVLLGKFLESYARGRTASAINSLTALRPKTARLIKNNFNHVLTLNEVVNNAEIPTDTRKERNKSDDEVLIDSSFIHRGDVLRVLEGDAIPADGVVASTIGVDESMITGEARIAKKHGNDNVYGGTNCAEGSTTVTVTACGDDSVLGKIVSTVQDAQASKPPIQEMADTVARYFVPLIAFVSVCTLVIWTLAWMADCVPVKWYGGSRADRTADAHNFMLYAFLFALAVWVSACPCAFGLATPTAVLVSTGLAARYGVLIRKGAALQFAADVDTVCFDKTGTLTCGKTAVSDFVIVSSRSHIAGTAFSTELVDVYKRPPSEGHSRVRHATLVHLLLSAEVQSSHPLAVGVAQFCLARLTDLGMSAVEATPIPGELKVVPGQGIMFSISSLNDANFDRLSDIIDSSDLPTAISVLVGSPVLMAAHSVELPQPVMRAINGLRAGGKVALLVAVNGSVRAVIGVADMVREESAAVVESLRRRGILTYMITGDAQNTAYAIGSVVGIPRDRIFAGTKPKEKEVIVNALVNVHGRKVAFVGDGTNDSPALARASVGIAMSSGSSIAIESGDMVLCKDDLQSVVTALDLSVKTMRRIKINYIWALVYNACLVPVAAGIFVPFFGFKLAPTMAGMAMAASSVSIVVSSLLLQLYVPPASLVPESSYDNQSVGSSQKFSDTAPLSPSRHGLLDDSVHSESPRGSSQINDLRYNEDICACPVSTAPSFHLVEPPWAEMMSERLNEWLSQRIDGFSAATRVDTVQNIMHPLENDAPSTAYSLVSVDNESDELSVNRLHDDDEGELLQRVRCSLASAKSRYLPRPGLTAGRSPSNRQPKPKLSSCSCGKGNCKCGTDCQCGTSAKF
jgi:Cu+-exporting ATPase